MLESKPKHDTAQRIFRARLWTDEGFVIVTMVQNISVMPQPNQPDVKLHVYVTRPYTAIDKTAQMVLMGQYAVDEIVAFLALDTRSVDEVQWTDDTKYSPIVVVESALARIH